MAVVVEALKKGKAPGIDNTLAELGQAGSDCCFDTILQKNMANDHMTHTMDRTTGHNHFHERKPSVSELLNKQLHQAAQYRHVESHLEQAETIRRELFRAADSITEQIFNLRIICVKHCNNSKTSIMSSFTSEKLQRGYDIQHCRQP